jgi:hypothetical protein
MFSCGALSKVASPVNIRDFSIVMQTISFAGWQKINYINVSIHIIYNKNVLKQQGHLVAGMFNKSLEYKGLSLLSTDFGHGIYVELFEWVRSM